MAFFLLTEDVSEMAFVNFSPKVTLFSPDHLSVPYSLNKITEQRHSLLELIASPGLVGGVPNMTHLGFSYKERLCALPHLSVYSIIYLLI